MQKRCLLITTLIAFFLLGGCSGLFPGVYKIDIPQGNLVNEEQVKQIKIGMNRRQVRFVLGSPLLVDTFNQDRWDYFYSVSQGNNTQVQHHITIIFTDGIVSDIRKNQKEGTSK